jgi:hypothetical protein
MYSSIQPQSSSSSSSKDWCDAALSAAGPAVEVDTGCGELPEGLEMVVKLMVPGEVASAVCAPRYAYQVQPPDVAVCWSGGKANSRMGGTGG